MKQYHDLLQKIVDEGVVKQDRTGIGTRSIFGAQMRFNLLDGFPLLTTKKIYTKSLIVELLWFLRGDTNIKFLHDHNVHIWDEWADENGDLGPVYGKQWRSWSNFGWDEDRGQVFWNGAIDQISNVIQQIKTNPYSRRHIVSAWNPAEVDDMALPPCHTMFQFNVRPGKDGLEYLDCQLYQRSGDFFLGVPFNIASYALLTVMVAIQTSLIPGEFIHTLGDAHLYNNHIDQAKELLSRDPEAIPLPLVRLRRGVESIFDYKLEDIQVLHYNPMPAISAPIAI